MCLCLPGNLSWERISEIFKSSGVSTRSSTFLASEDIWTDLVFTDHPGFEVSASISEVQEGNLGSFFGIPIGTEPILTPQKKEFIIRPDEFWVVPSYAARALKESSTREDFERILSSIDESCIIAGIVLNENSEDVNGQKT